MGLYLLYRRYAVRLTVLMSVSHAEHYTVRVTRGSPEDLDG